MIFRRNVWTMAAAVCLLSTHPADPAFAAAAMIDPPAGAEVRGESAATGTKQAAPNLTPLSPTTTPLLRKINLTSAAMIPPFYCERVQADRETEVDVPPFDWGVANDQGAAITQPFVVSVLDGKSKTTPLAKETVPSIPQSGTRVYRNWPGRPTRVQVLKVTAGHPQFGSEYGSTPGCYIPTALAGRVRFDPQPLIVRVDAGGQITERVESDNELTR